MKWGAKAFEMKPLHLPAMSAAMAALLIVAAAEVAAQQRSAGGGPRITIPPPAPIGSFGTFSGVIVVEREVPVIVEREVVRDAQPAAPAPSPPPPRKPYVIGNTYDSLPPEGCMKMIEGGASYYYCNGEWYRQVGGGKDAQYRAVAQP